MRPRSAATAGTAIPPARSPDHEYRSGDGKEDRGRDDTRHGDDESDQGRSDSSQIEALKRVHVPDHSADQVTAPESLELRRGEGLDSRVEALADPAETPQREIVRRQPLEVAGERTRQPEEPDDDDRDGEREDGRLLRGARDQVARGRHQSDAEDDRERAERNRERHA